MEAGDRGLAAEDFEIVKPISRGAHGKVHLCRKRATGDVYAMKVMRKKDLIYKNMVSQAMAERDALINTDNPFIVKLYYSFSSTRHVYIVTEFAVGATCPRSCSSSDASKRATVGNTPRRSRSRSSIVTSEGSSIATSSRYLLIAANGHLKLTDFGLSKIGVARTGVGTSANAAVPRDIPTSARTRTARVSDGSVDVRAGNATDPYPFDGGIGSWETDAAGASAPASAPASAGADTRAGHTLHPNPNPPNLAPSSAYAPSTNAPSSAYAPSGYATSGYGSDAGTAGGPSDVGSSKFDYSRSGAREDAGAGMAKGTPDYLAPEVLMCEPYGPEVDWWALGAVVFELLVGVPPFHAETPVKIFENILGGDIAWPPDPGPNRTLDSDSDDDDAGLSPVAKEFIARLLCPEAELRLGAARGAAGVKAHAFFRDVDFDAVLASQQRDVAADADADTRGGCVPVFVPQPEDPLDTSYFARKPRRGAERERGRSSGSSDRMRLAIPAPGFSAAYAADTGAAHASLPGSKSAWILSWRLSRGRRSRTSAYRDAVADRVDPRSGTRPRQPGHLRRFDTGVVARDVRGWRLGRRVRVGVRSPASPPDRWRSSRNHRRRAAAASARSRERSRWRPGIPVSPRVDRKRVPPRPWGLRSGWDWAGFDRPRSRVSLERERTRGSETRRRRRGRRRARGGTRRSGA